MYFHISTASEDTKTDHTPQKILHTEPSVSTIRLATGIIRRQNIIHKESPGVIFKPGQDPPT